MSDEFWLCEECESSNAEKIEYCSCCGAKKSASAKMIKTDTSTIKNQQIGSTQMKFSNTAKASKYKESSLDTTGKIARESLDRLLDKKENKTHKSSIKIHPIVRSIIVIISSVSYIAIGYFIFHRIGFNFSTGFSFYLNWGIIVLSAILSGCSMYLEFDELDDRYTSIVSNLLVLFSSGFLLFLVTAVIFEVGFWVSHGVFKIFSCLCR